MSRRLTLPVIFCAMIWILFPSFGIADENGPSRWEGEAELGYLMSTGNTESRSLNAALGIGYTTEKWRHRFAYETVYSYEKNEGTTAQRFLVSGRTRYDLGGRNALYGLSLYENDRFAGYDYQFTLSAGYSRQLVMTDSIEWSAEIGPGYRRTRLSGDEESTEEEALAHLGTVFEYRFTDNISFKEDLSVDAGDAQTIVRSATSLRILLIESISLRISHVIRHVTDVPEDTKKTDTNTFLALVYSL